MFQTGEKEGLKRADGLEVCHAGIGKERRIFIKTEKKWIFWEFAEKREKYNDIILSLIHI